jgi:FkbM family methyltransferase
MVHIYSELHAYDTISREIENNFHIHINKTKDEIKTIVVVGGYNFSEGISYLNNYPNAKIHVFEPVFEFINQACLAYSDYSDRCTFYNMALGNTVGNIEFYRTSVPGSDSMFPVIPNNQSGYSFKNIASIQVPCNKLSNIIKQNIDLLIIDVQGAELEVLKGSNLNNVNCIFAEVQLTENKNNAVYNGQCFMDDLSEYLNKDFYLHSVGLDNELKNGTGNAFWVKNTKH